MLISPHTWFMLFSVLYSFLKRPHAQSVHINMLYSSVIGAVLMLHLPVPAVLCLISVAPRSLKPRPSFSNFSPSLLWIPHIFHPMADFLFWQKPCWACFTHTHTQTHTNTQSTNTAWPWPSGRPVHIHNVLHGCGDTSVCVSLFAVCDCACRHPAAVCMFYPAVYLLKVGASSGALVTSQILKRNCTTKISGSRFFHHF